MQSSAGGRKSEPVMICSVCGSTAFRTTEYTSGRDVARSAPALECLGCGAISLREEAAASEEERESVKIAIALRAHVAGEAKKPALTPDAARGSTHSTARIKVR